MKKNKFIISVGMTIMLFLTGIRLEAQEISVTGTVKDAVTQRLLMGVKVKTAEHSASSITDENGVYTIKVFSLSDVLIVNAPDYAQREIPLQGRQSIDIVLYSSAFASGYENVESLSGNLRRTENTQSESDASGYDNSTAFSIESDIQARLGGSVRTITRSGAVGIGASMFIRGFNSLNASSMPLFVVDGVVFDNQLDAASIHQGYFSNPLANIETKDIESITILKDGNSVYGSKASNGVILINTVRGKELATKITANLSWGVNARPTLPKMMDASQYKIFASNQVNGFYQSRNFLNPWESRILRDFPFLDDNMSSGYWNYHNSTNWADEVYQDGFLQNYSLGVSGGDDVALYNLSMGYTTNAGVLKNTSLQRMNARFNSDINLSSRLFSKVDLAVSQTMRDLRDDGVDINTSPGFIALAKSPLLSPYIMTEDGTRSQRFSDYDAMNPQSPMSNPVVLTDKAIGSSSRMLFSFKINPWFKFNSNLLAGAIFNYRLHRVKESFFIPEFGVAPKKVSQFVDAYVNEVRDLSQRQSSLFSEAYLKWNFDINKTNHFNFWGGFRYSTDVYEWDLPSGYNTGNDNVKVLTDGVGVKKIIGDNKQWKSMSWYGNVDYNFKHKYIISLTASADASSRFGQETKGGFGMGGTRWALFPSASGAWIVSSENFMSSLPVINFLKLRASYGLTGNDGIDVRANRSYLESVYYMGGATGLQIANIQNKAIEWETSAKAGAGIDVHLLNERLLLSADIFSSQTDNLLTQKALEHTAGIDYYWSNAGALKNAGYEIELTAKLLNIRSVKWELGGSIGHYKNEITALPDGDYITEILNGSVLTAVGRPAGVFYGYKTKGVFSTTKEAETVGLNKLNENGLLSPYSAGDVWFDDPDHNGIITTRNGVFNGVACKDDRQVIGDPNPDFYGNIVSRLKVKNFTLDALFTYSYGNDVYNYMRSQLESGATFYNQTRAMTNRWTTEGQVTNIPRAVYADPMGNNVFSDRWIEDGSYIRLKTVTLSCDIPVNSIYIKGITLWASANNLITWSKYLGSDPEFSMNSGVLYQGIDAGLMPQGRSYFMGIKINL
ncbi:MAG: SusC/RagA family TonB-linked outer membrane protein [Dysgonamonadaceae bacterium]|jgi:TonB-linked SusC/RagA family outer membrane protein|nr:SusC/RagA family TonB-linked outer membrane protein [Dysgonamonadaceae bacterium]